MDFVLGILPVAEGVATAIGSALESIKTDALGVIATVAPVGLSIAGAFFVWRMGVRFFKTISK